MSSCPKLHRFGRFLGKRSALLSAIIATACDPGGPTEPEPIELPVKLTVSEAAGISGPIRLAVVWRQGSGSDQRWISTFDTGLTGVPESTQVWFSLPPSSERPALVDVNRAYVSCDEDDEYPIRFSAAVPRLVAYEDSDQSGDFDPDLPLSPGPDRVLAVNPGASTTTYIAAFTDLDVVLAKLPMEYAECVRSYTGDRYSAFFTGTEYSDYLWAQSTLLAPALQLSPTAYAAVAMGCDRSDVYTMVNQNRLVKKERSTLVDDRLVPDPCTSAPWQCSRAEVENLDVPEPTPNAIYPGFSEFFLCTAVGDLDVLWFVKETMNCNGCECDWLHSHQTWVVDGTRPPAGWPCGKQVRYCSTHGQSIWEWPSYCDSNSLERTY